MDIFSCMWITQWYKNVQQNETQKVYFGNKNVQQNETQKVYFGNIASNILTACCHNKSLDDINGQKKDSITIVSESKEHNRIAALTCLKKVIEEAEKKSMFQNTRRSWSGMTVAPQFWSRFIFCLFTEDFFDFVELSWC